MFGPILRRGLCRHLSTRRYATISALEKAQNVPSEKKTANESTDDGLLRFDEEDLPKGFQLSLKNASISREAMQIRYATFGDPSNPSILLCPSMSNSAFAINAVSKDGMLMKGWWNHVIGYGEEYGIDLNKYHVICGAALGGPFGTTSPLTMDANGTKFGPNFPAITPVDIAACQALMLDKLGIDKVFAVVGGSMGGMQALQFACHFPDRYDRVVAIASTAHTSPSTVALRAVQRSAVRMDPKFNSGHYSLHDEPVDGLAIARRFGTICYRSRVEFDDRFNWHFDEQSGKFEIESYLDYQAEKFVKHVNYDANCYLLLSHAMDRMYLGTNDLDFQQGALRIPEDKSVMLLSYDTDVLCPPEDLLKLSSVLGQHGRDVYFETLKSRYGHDAFLVAKEGANLNIRLRAFLKLNAGTAVDNVHNVVKELHYM